VLNLLQSRFLFRMGDAHDAEEAARIAMAVYSTMIRDDPDSRARLRVTPEQLLNFPNYFCLASWIANGTRAPAFTGETYPLPDAGDEWAKHHLAAQAERVGPYPEQLESTLDARAAATEPGDNGSKPASSQPSPREYLAVRTRRRTTPRGSGRAGTRKRKAGSSPPGSTPRRSRAGERQTVQRATVRKARRPPTEPGGEERARRAAGQSQRTRRSDAGWAPRQARGTGRLRTAPAYDVFLCGWSLAHPRYQTQGTRSAVVFVCPNPRSALACAREADAALTGRMG
jgi:hypothetical protein